MRHILQRHISEMTQQEMESMQDEVKQAAINICQKNNLGALSHAGWFSFYSALEDAVRGEWEKAKSIPGV